MFARINTLYTAMEYRIVIWKGGHPLLANHASAASRAASEICVVCVEGGFPDGA